MKRTIFALAIATSIHAFANDDTVLKLPVVYAKQATAPENIKEKCNLEDVLSKQIEAVLSKQNKSGVGVVPADGSANDANTLHVEITNAFGLGGGVWSGAKVLSISADLIDKQGKVVRRTNLTRGSTGGMFAEFKGTCSIIGRDAKKLAQDIGKWITDPHAVTEDAPQTADQAQAANK